jgi:flagellar hook-associated protein 1 FlgK
MSLSGALTAATSSLLAIQTQMGVTSSNISNASVTGYTAETVSVTTEVAGGVGVGVLTNGIVSQVSAYLEKNIVAANSDSAYASTINSYMDTLQSSLGSITSSSTSASSDDLTSYLSSLSSALTQLSGNPQDTALRDSVVSDLSKVTSSLQTTASGVNSQQVQIGNDINSAVDTTNTALKTLASLNTQIITLKAQGQSTAALEDQQRNALSQVSQELNINYFSNSSGQLTVTTAGGQVLVSGSSSYSLSYNGISAPAATPPSTPLLTVGNNNISADVTSGTIGGLLNLATTQLPAVSNELNNLATNLASALNSVSNLGSSNPAPNTLNGTQIVSSTAASPISISTTTGTPSIAITTTDQSGNVINTNQVDLSGLGSPTTLAAIVSAINTQDGTNVTAAVSSTGTLSITANNANDGVGVSTLNGTYGVTTASGGVTSGDFSTAFGLNDVLVGTVNSSGQIDAASLRVRSNIQSDPNYLPVGQLGTSPLTSTASITSSAVTVTGGKIVLSLHDASGNALAPLTVTVPTGATTLTAIASAIQTAMTGAGSTSPYSLYKATVSGSGTTSSPYTLSLSLDTSNSNSSAYSNDVLSVATPSGSTYSVNGGTATDFAGAFGLNQGITSGDTTIASALQNALSTSTTKFSASGNLAANTTSITDYASSIIGDIANRASNADTSASASASSLTTLQSSFSNQSGVNVTQETANLVTLQNAYATSAKVISVVQTMFEDLINAMH